MRKFRALLSVYDKTHLLTLAKALAEKNWELLASGQTAQYLREAGFAVVDIATYTGSPEILGGRVKTLHPAVHGGLLARSTKTDHEQLQSLGWDYIDLVAVNLYPFVETIAKPGITEAEAIEQIDIGGVTLIRAAAKNHERVVLLSDPNDYARVIQEWDEKGDISLTTRRELAVKGFAATSAYDAAITAYFSPQAPVQHHLYPIQSLRYGENPHQTATLYATDPKATALSSQLLQGKELSYNNLLDLDAAWRAAQGFSEPTVVIVKHLSPCGIASAETVKEAFVHALASDPISAFGGIIACNRAVDVELVQAFGDLFIECIVAPEVTAEAQQLLAKRVNCRVLVMQKGTLARQEWRTIHGGWLCQTLDQGDPAETTYRVVSQKQPTDAEWDTLRFAWQACQHVKSNAIVLAQGRATVGIGGGQTNRIDSVRTAVIHAGERAQGSVLASDAFFPFTDTVEAAAKAGITAVIQPGGAKRDPEVIATADALGLVMVFTGVRHFRH